MKQKAGAGNAKEVSPGSNRRHWMTSRIVAIIHIYILLGRGGLPRLAPGGDRFLDQWNRKRPTGRAPLRRLSVCGADCGRAGHGLDRGGKKSHAPSSPPHSYTEAPNARRGRLLAHVVSYGEFACTLSCARRPAHGSTPCLPCGSPSCVALMLENGAQLGADAAAAARANEGHHLTREPLHAARLLDDPH